MEKLGKITRGLGIAVEVIIVIEFLKELYQWSMPRLKKLARRPEEDEQPQEPDEEGGNADYEPEQ